MKSSLLIFPGLRKGEVENPPSAARTMMRELRAMRDPARADGVQRYFKNAVVSLGLDTPTLREYARSQVQRLRPVWTADQAVGLCDRLLREPELEIRGLGILVLNGFRREFTPRLLPTAKRWLRTRLDNWALVDSFCGSVLSLLLEQHPPVEAALRRWSGDKVLWVRRAALVTLVPFARRGRRLDLAYDLAAQHFPDPEDLMHKATGWLLREAGKTDPPRLKRFLLRHGPAIPRTALRYAIERFPAAERAGLLKATRRT
jgi:3-methyladenine DNA glycosylase AlkD